MIPVIAPFGINWFYESQAGNLAEDLSARRLPARAIPSHEWRSCATARRRRC